MKFISFVKKEKKLCNNFLFYTLIVGSFSINFSLSIVIVQHNEEKKIVTKVVYK